MKRAAAGPSRAIGVVGATALAVSLGVGIACSFPSPELVDLPAAPAGDASQDAPAPDAPQDGPRDTASPVDGALVDAGGDVVPVFDAELPPLDADKIDRDPTVVTTARMASPPPSGMPGACRQDDTQRRAP